MKKSSGSWKKERTTGRKYSQSDVHKAPKAGKRKKIWVSAYFVGKKKVKGYFRKNPWYK